MISAASFESVGIVTELRAARVDRLASRDVDRLRPPDRGRRIGKRSEMLADGYATGR